MPIGFVTAQLAYAEHKYLHAKREVRRGMLGNCTEQREVRDYWWAQYRKLKA